MTFKNGSKKKEEKKRERKRGLLYSFEHSISRQGLTTYLQKLIPMKKRKQQQISESQVMQTPN